MEQIAFVFQNSRLFKASILENVRASRPNATRGEVRAALMAAQCGDILEKLPKGIDTQLGPEGTYLSGGEQQRIALARAILKDAPIVVLDEATAFADPENEALIQKAFTTLTKGRTVIMIAHRLSTVCLLYTSGEAFARIVNGDIAAQHYRAARRQRGLQLLRRVHAIEHCDNRLAVLLRKHTFALMALGQRAALGLSLIHISFSASAECQPELR